MVNLWEHFVEKGQFHIQFHRTGRSVLRNGKRPKKSIIVIPYIVEFSCSCRSLHFIFSEAQAKRKGNLAGI